MTKLIGAMLVIKYIISKIVSAILTGLKEGWRDAKTK